MSHMTLADEHGPALRDVDGLDVDIPRMIKLLGFLAPAVGRPQPFGPCGVSVRLYASSGVCNGSIVVSQAEHDGAEWIHASVARENHMPTYADLARLHHAVFGPERYAFQVFAPRSEHVNIHARALHLWGCADGANPLPAFGAHGTI
jgi:hypothetical protein